MSDDALDAFRAGDDDAARRAAERVLESDGDLSARVSALCTLARLALRAGDVEESERLASKALGWSGDRAPLQSQPLHLLAATARLSGRLEVAKERYERSIALHEELGIAEAVSAERRNLAYVLLHLGRVDEAAPLLESGASRDLAALDGAVLAWHRGDPSAAAGLLAEAREQWATSRLVLDPDDMAELQMLERLLDQGE